MKAYAAFPSADPMRGEVCRTKWECAGYRVLTFYDHAIPAEVYGLDGSVRFYDNTYPGYYGIAARLARACFSVGADTVTLIGDDMEPDRNLSGPEIAELYDEHFPDGFGILQACGDRQGVDSSGKPASERICGSPTFGAAWAKRAYGGIGPVWPGYHSYYGDEDLYEVAGRLSVLWMNPEITITHKHWSFGHGSQADYQKRNSDLHWQSDKDLFYSRKAAGFPNSEPIA